jgi:heme/copper-type cytochrome/quinol oxidase subunit 2
MRVFRIAVLTILAAAAVMLFVLPPPVGAQPQHRQFILDARQFEYAPGRFEVNVGDRVSLTLTASDVVHGFYLDGYGIERRITPGQSVTVEFLADRAGKFRYRCSVSCGPLHPFMIGELVVGPNAPFWQAVSFVLMALFGALIQLYTRSSREASNGKTQEPS